VKCVAFQRFVGRCQQQGDCAMVVVVAVVAMVMGEIGQWLSFNTNPA
jgi:hypothetical protein